MVANGQTLGERLVLAMKRKGLKNPTVAAAAGVGTVTVSRWRTDVQVPSDEQLRPVASLLGVTIAWLRYGEGEEPAAGPSHPEADSRGAGLEGGRSHGVPRVAMGLPYAVRVWLQGFLLEITKAGATEAQVDEARQLLTAPEVFVYWSGGNPHEFDEAAVLEGMDAMAEGVRRKLRRDGLKL